MTSSLPVGGEPPPLPPLDKVRPEHIAYVRSVVARFRVSPLHVREDLVQEVLFAAYRARRSKLEVRALLFGVTRHIVLRWIQRRVSEHSALAQGALAPLEDRRTPEDAYHAEERCELVHAALADLPEVSRDILLRSVVEGAKMPEIARDLGIPLNTGHTRLHKARERFLQALWRHLLRSGVGGEVQIYRCPWERRT